MQLSVIGDTVANNSRWEQAYAVGRLAALRGWVVVTGGMGGVMEATSKGAFDAGGITVGILPIYARDEANPYIKIIIPSGMGHARNALVAAAADAVIAVGGGYGTLSEIALALKLGKPVVGINTWPGLPGVHHVADADAAVAAVVSLTEAQRR